MSKQKKAVSKIQIHNSPWKVVTRLSFLELKEGECGRTGSVVVFSIESRRFIPDRQQESISITSITRLVLGTTEISMQLK